MKTTKEERITIRIPGSTRTMVDLLAERYETSNSEIIRVLVEKGIMSLLPPRLGEPRPKTSRE